MSQALSILIAFSPFLVLIWLANLAEVRRKQDVPDLTLERFCLFALGILFCLLLVVGIIIHVSDGFLTRILPLLQEWGYDITAADIAAQISSLTLVGIGLWLPALGGLLLLTQPVRRLVARIMPIDPDNVVHTVALAMTMLILTSMFVTLGIGLSNITARLIEQAASGQELALNDTFIAVWTQQIMTALIALVGVGWLTRRRWQDSLARLGIVPLTRADFRIGVGIGAGMVPLVLVMGGVANLAGIGPDPDVGALTDQLLGPLFDSPFGILTLGVAAALGEETIFRGALQPRFGLLLTTFFFAIVHSNYGLSYSTLVVFIVGLVLGWARLRHSTSVCMVIHAVYNISIGLLAYLSLQFLQTQG